MNTTEFKTAISEAKESLRGKTLTVKFVNGGTIKKLSFTSLKSFGNAILEMEKLGAGFGFIKVGNHIVERGIYKAADFQKVLNRGIWSEVTFLATTVK
ncbi:hypothetical protein LZ575_03065 [Antarcticibacterium sp. 1MA-6-2]|uniref:hypothetical protein n=1 Tax=Antarcticibacterium sp. 1MA-6-2 TaxID=2908210 RepID=UPI001F3F7EBA|nr:hypothetical protein [Antarcticibacterium sp. 1MA-6-2]UJH91683.1 hypothetical protein LZ575_03065 [Antarcticibacterium sp. 1MA-6-2]